MLNTMMGTILKKSSSVSGVILKKGSSSSELHLHSGDGSGRMIFYTLFPGMHLAFIDVNSPVWPESDTNNELRPLLVNYCISGRSELLLDDNTYIYIKERDISVSGQTAQKEYIFPKKCYEGIKIYFDVELLVNENRPVLDSFGIDFARIQEIYCGSGKTYIAEAHAEIELICNKLWGLFRNPSLFHMKIYVMELLHLLLEDKMQQSKPCTFYTGIQVQIAKKAEQILTSDIRKHYPIRCLAEQFSISETSLKNYFRGVYGQNISSYLQEVRMNAAAKMLAETQSPISEISEQVGYTNQGKFAAVFKRQFELTPFEYRRIKRLEKI